MNERSRASLRRSIVRGVVETVREYLLDDEDRYGKQQTDQWEDGPSGKLWRGSEVIEECQRVLASLEAWAQDAEDPAEAGEEA